MAKRIAGLLVGLLVGIGMPGPAPAQVRSSAELRATGMVGEQSNGYLALVADAPSSLRAQVDAINIRRRARYTQIASRRGATVEEAAAAVACQIFATRILPGQYYRLPDGVWRRRNGDEPVPRPDHCG
jgi:uncharacterized protein YdbL (DUF1318 family)